MRDHLRALGALVLFVVAAAYPAGAAITKGPYLQNAAADGVTVCWVSDVEETGAVKYGIGALLDKRAAAETPARIQQVRITGLDADTEYAYQVVSGTATSALSTFRTAAPKGKPFRFAVYGDPKGGDEVHSKIVRQMMQFKPGFVVCNGDLVSDGLKPENWDGFFKVADPLMQRFPYYSTLGNHERNSPLYFDYFALPGNERWYSFEWGDCHFIVLDSDPPYLSSEEQRQWLINDLRQNEAVFTFAAFHHPVYSGTKNLNRRLGAAEIRKQWGDIFEEAGVDAVFNGHDHNYQHTFVNGVHYLITGGGGAGLYEVKTKYGFSKQVAVHHWLRVFVSGKRATVTAVDVSGKVLDNFTIAARE